MLVYMYGTEKPYNEAILHTVTLLVVILYDCILPLANGFLLKQCSLARNTQLCTPNIGPGESTDMDQLKTKHV